MAEATPPEIQRTSLAAVVLCLKALSLDIDVLKFDFLDPPPVSSHLRCHPSWDTLNTLLAELGYLAKGEM